MVTKVVGIIGEGDAMQHFLSDNSSVDLAAKKQQILRVLDGIVFYNHSYYSSSDFVAAKLGTISSYLDKLGVKHRAEDGFGPKDSFAEFVGASDVIIDGTRGHRFASLHALANKLKVGYDITNYAPDKKDIEDDFKKYNTRADKSKRKMLESGAFEERWNLTFEIMRTAAQVNKDFPIGWRILDELPFNAPVFVERGQQLQEIINHGLTHPPTYINLANEPCLTSAMMVGNCPAMAPYVVACNGFDVSRLRRIFEDTDLYKGIMERCHVKKDEITISLRGFHDQQVMIPIVQSRDPNSNALYRLLNSGLSYTTMYQHLTTEVGSYWNNYNLESGHRKKRDVNDEIDNSILDLLSNALASRGKALSLFPHPQERPLCNGYFHIIDTTNNYGKGFFFMGEHRFRNGQVVADE